MSSIVEVIQHYQRSIETSQENEARLLHCINKLYKLPIKVEHLQETGVGKTVNSLRKFNGEIGVAAKAVVTKWKAMVAAEEEPMDTSAHTTENEIHDNHNGDGSAADDDDDRNGSAEEDENHNLNNTIHKKSADSKKDKEKDRHREKSHKDSSSKSSSSSQHERSAGKHSSEKTKTSSTHSTPTSSSSSSVEKEKSHHKSSSSSSKDKTRDRERSEQKDKDRSEKRKEDKKQEASTSHHKSSSSSNNDHGSSSSSKSKHDSSRDKSDKDKAAASSLSSSHKNSSKDKDKTKEEKSKDKHRSSSSSSSSGKISSSASKDEETERKRRHNSDNDSNDFKSPQPPKIAKVHNKSSTKSEERSTHNSTSPPQEQHQPHEDDADDSFDSSMGANFDDVLGMLNVPRKKGKKSLTSTATSSVKPSPSKSSSSSSSSNDKPSTSKSNGLKSTTSPPSYSASPSFSAKPTMKLDLLAPTAKLEPLDPSIALELPSISTNYKPMPLNQTVMDVVFNTSSAKPARTLTDAEALQHGISSKTMRTKIYSGTRTGQVYQVPSLFDMCIRILQKNIDALEYTGGVPFEVLRPVLDKATPQQLFIFEDFNPYVMEDSDELWQHHVQRSYRTQRRLENESWREMFMRCQEEEERKLSFLKDSIKKSQKIAAAPVRKTQLAFVDSMVKPPRNVQRKQEQFGTKAKLVATPAARVAALQTVTPNAAKQGDTRLRTAVNVRDHAQVSSNSSRPKKAPLMQKTLQFMRGRHKR